MTRNLFASLLTACVLAVGFHGAAPAANAAAAGLPVVKAGESKSHVIEIKGRARSPRLYLPIVPYIAYDYPYYYSRGHYPTSIGHGYVYYGYPYSHYVRIYNERHGKRCSSGNRNCAAASFRRQRGAYR
jgi:hypothetical protein